MTEDSVVRFFLYSWTLIGLSGLFPIYLNRNGLKSKKNLLQTFVGSVLFITLGFFVETNKDQGIKLTDSEVIILLGIATVAFLSKLLPVIFELCVVKYEQNIPLRRDMKFKLVKTSFEKIKAKLKQEHVNEELIVITKGNYGMEFLMKSSFTDGFKSPVKFESRPDGSSFSRFRILFVLSAYTSIMALAENNLRISIPLFSSRIDSELFFVVFILLLYSFLFLQHSIQHNFFLEFEQLQKYILPELAKSTYKPDGEEGDGFDVDLKSDLDSVKERARKIKDSKAKQALDEKRQKARERVSHIIGTSEDEEIDPELLKKQILIRRVKTLLKSTPVGYSASLPAITEKVESKNEKEIEAIIVGLIDRKEVSGSYDMWSQNYSNGDVSAQFIDRTLSNLELDPSELEFIKVNKSGEVEIRFKNEKMNGKENTNSKKTKVTTGKKKTDEQN